MFLCRFFWYKTIKLTVFLSKLDALMFCPSSYHSSFWHSFGFQVSFWQAIFVWFKLVHLACHDCLPGYITKLRAFRGIHAVSSCSDWVVCGASNCSAVCCEYWEMRRFWRQITYSIVLTKENTSKQWFPYVITNLCVLF